MDPTWMYGPQGEAVLLTDEAAMRKAVRAGYKNSPAAFGIETAPGAPEEAMLISEEVEGGSPDSGA